MGKDQWTNFKIAGTATMLLLGSWTTAGDFPRENILKNSGFEKADGWNFGKIELVEGGLNGTKCAALKADVPSGANGFRGVAFQEVKNPPGGRYILTGYIRRDGLRAVYLCVDCKPEVKPYRKFFSSGRLEKTAEEGWVRFVVPIEIPDGRQSARVVIQLFSELKNRVLMLDDVSFVHQKESLEEKE